MKDWIHVEDGDMSKIEDNTEVLVNTYFVVIMVLVMGEIFLNSNVGYRLIDSQNETTYVLTYSIYFKLLVHYPEYG